MTDNTKTRRGLLGAAAVAAIVAGAGVARFRQPAIEQPSAQSGTPTGASDIWALRFPKPEGGEWIMADFRGKPLVVNFWATWCAPCVKEMPQLDRFARDFKAKGWQVVGLAIDSPTPVREFLARIPVSFPIGLAGMDGTALSRALGNDKGALPFSVVFAASGAVLQRHLGETSYDQLAGWANKAG